MYTIVLIVLFVTVDALTFQLQYRVDVKNEVGDATEATEINATS